MSYLCRICLQAAEDIISLFSDCEESQNILLKIYLCTQTTLEPDKELPGVICGTCLQELHSAYNFRKKCITIQTRFKTYRESSNTDTNIKFEQDEFSSSLFNEESLNGTDDNRLFNQINNVGSVANIDIKQIEIKSNDSFQCDICTKVLKSKLSLIRHKELMHVKRKYAGRVTGYGSSRRYHCTTCSYSTPHSQTLTNHVRRHEGDRPYVCECGKSFTQAASLAAHKKSHSPATFFTCTKCGKQFKFAYALKTHLKVHENGTYSCHICQKVLKQRRTLTAHIHRHYNIHNYSCHECGKTFVTIADLINHRKGHDVTKTVECHICSYKTNTKKNLTKHLQRHTGEKPYNCCLCDASFFTSNELKLHQRKHTHEKPFSCPSCSHRFAHSSSLNKHMQTLHRVTYKWSEAKLKEISPILTINKIE